MSDGFDQRGPNAPPVRVSYIISTRNRGPYLEQALANVREFITTDDELLIIDGGSTDNTREVVERSRDVVAYYLSESDRGEAHGFNKGLLAARGQYIKPITDDDYFYPDAMRQLITVAESHPEIDALMCGGEAYRRDPDTGEDRFLRFQHLPADKRLAEDSANVLLHTTCGLGLFFRRRVIPLAGLFDTTFRAVDADFSARLIATGTNFRYLHIKLFRHIEHAHSGQRIADEMLRDARRLQLRMRRWDLFSHTYSFEELSRGLGLDGLKHASAFADVILMEEHLRRSPLGFLLWPLRWLLKAPHALVKHSRKLLRGIRSADLPPTEKHIDWDGSLR